MSKLPKILWLEGIFDEPTIRDFPAVSPAVNFWLRGFISALQTQGCEVTLIGHPYDRIWPAGRMFVRAAQARMAAQFSGSLLGYINMPLLRTRSQSLNYLRAVKQYVATHGLPDYVVTFNDTPGTAAARYLRRLGVTWIYVAGDGPTLPGADGYLYQNWCYYESPESPGPKIHLDGGLPSLSAGPAPATCAATESNALMFMGALTEHGGVTPLARAFHSLPDKDIELWVTGRGSNPELERLVAIDPRIKLYGFVSPDELHALASRARAFANPRPTDFAPNKLNYPSKLLHYLAYGKPVISTFTEGLSPDYHDVLIPIADESENGLASAIKYTMTLPPVDYRMWCERVAQFNATRSWQVQMERLLSWLDREFKSPHGGNQ